jgi:hypothetical protein
MIEEFGRHTAAPPVLDGMTPALHVAGRNGKFGWLYTQSARGKPRGVK